MARPQNTPNRAIATNARLPEGSSPVRTSTTELGQYVVDKATPIWQVGDFIKQLVNGAIIDKDLAGQHMKTIDTIITKIKAIEGSGVGGTPAILRQPPADLFGSSPPINVDARATGTGSPSVNRVLFPGATANANKLRWARLEAQALANDNATFECFKNVTVFDMTNGVSAVCWRGHAAFAATTICHAIKVTVSNQVLHHPADIKFTTLRCMLCAIVPNLQNKIPVFAKITPNGDNWPRITNEEEHIANIVAVNKGITEETLYAIIGRVIILSTKSIAATYAIDVQDAAAVVPDEGIEELVKKHIGVTHSTDFEEEDLPPIIG